MKKELIRKPLELLFLLSDRCMSLLSSNAWKVVCVVARETIGVYNARVITGNDPVQLLNRDLRSVGVPIEDVAAAVASLSAVDQNHYPPPSFAFISLKQICAGMRNPDGTHKNFGSGLSKSSAVEAINEAIKLGILERKTRKGPKGRDLASGYRINWYQVFELSSDLKKKRSAIRFRCPPSGRARVRNTDTPAPS